MLNMRRTFILRSPRSPWAKTCQADDECNQLVDVSGLENPSWCSKFVSVLCDHRLSERLYDAAYFDSFSFTASFLGTWIIHYQRYRLPPPYISKQAQPPCPIWLRHESWNFSKEEEEQSSHVNCVVDCIRKQALIMFIFYFLLLFKFVNSKSASLERAGSARNVARLQSGDDALHASEKVASSGYIFFKLFSSKFSWKRDSPLWVIVI